MEVRSNKQIKMSPGVYREAKLPDAAVGILPAISTSVLLFTVIWLFEKCRKTAGKKGGRRAKSGKKRLRRR